MANQFQPFARIAKNKCGFGCMWCFARVRKSKGKIVFRNFRKKIFRLFRIYDNWILRCLGCVWHCSETFSNHVKNHQTSKFLLAPWSDRKSRRLFSVSFLYRSVRFKFFVLVLQEQPLDDQEMEEDLIYVSQKLNEIEQTLSRWETFNF